MNNERYFIAFFRFYKDDGKQGDIVNAIITNGGYLNCKAEVEYVKKETGLKIVFITNIIEISESDYLDFIKNYDNDILHI